MRLLKPALTSLNGKIMKPTGDAKQKETNEGLAVRGRNKSPTKVIAVPPSRGVGRERVYGKTKGRHKKRGGPVPY